MKAIFEQFVDFDFFAENKQDFFFHIDKIMKNHDDSEKFPIQSDHHHHDKILHHHLIQNFPDDKISKSG